MYKALVAQDQARVRDLVKLVDVPRNQVYSALVKLRDKGMCVEHLGRFKLYSAVDPEAAFQRLLSERREEISKLEAGVKRLSQIYAQRMNNGIRPDSVEVYKGQALVALMRQMHTEVEHEVLTFSRYHPIVNEVGLARTVSREAGLLQRGVKVRCIYERECLSDPLIGRYVHKIAEQGEEARVTDSLPADMNIFDRKTVSFPLVEPEGGVTAYIFRHPSLVKIIEAGFEQVWQNARPVLSRKRKTPGAEHKERTGGQK